MRELTFESLANAVGVVSQETYLFHATVRDNLRFARSDATDEEVEEAARAAQIHDLIAGLPDGYDTVVGERGYRFSGGERQRIAIARTILRNPPILVLDEATSALDTQTERAVQEALERLAEGRTTIAIAHRLSTVRDADQIVVLDRGLVAEIGTHEELLAAGGRYAALVSRDTEEVLRMSCTHLDTIRDVTPSAQGCEDCLRTGDRWVHLRLCLACGHVGCCDSSPNRHATKHFHATSHPLVQSFEPGEDWIWCYADEVDARAGLKRLEQQLVRKAVDGVAVAAGHRLRGEHRVQDRLLDRVDHGLVERIDPTVVQHPQRQLRRSR